MKVIKIDISKEVMDVPSGPDHLRFALRSPLSLMATSNDEQVPDVHIASTKDYLYQRVYHEGKNQEPTVYAVPVDDRNLFRDLVQVSDARINSLVEKRTEHLHWQHEMDLDRQKQRIKNLPWYKRLLGNF